MDIGHSWVRLAVVVLAISGCGGCGGNPPPPEYGLPLPGVDAAAFARGKAIFTHEFTVAEGLGPYYNATSCAACHSLPVVGGSGDAEHVAVFGSNPQNHGDLLSFRKYAVPGTVPETPPPNPSLRRAPPLFGMNAVSQVM